MNRERFLDMFNKLIGLYGAKKTFDADDYYHQVQYLPDSVLDKIKARIIEQCEYLPKPAELKKIAKEFALPFTVKQSNPDINYDNCWCGEPVYNSHVEAYLCKHHYELRQDEIIREKRSLKAMGYPVDHVCRGDSKPLQALLLSAMGKLREGL